MKEITWREFRGLSKQSIVESLPVRIRGLGVLVSEEEFSGGETDELVVRSGGIGDGGKKVGDKGEHNGLPTTWKKSVNGDYLVEWFDEVPEGYVSAVVSKSTGAKYR